MSKRGADKYLTDQNYDDDDDDDSEPQGSGLFPAASEETLQGRQIKKAKRRNAGNGMDANAMGSTGAFGGFTGFTATPSSASTTVPVTKPFMVTFAPSQPGLTASKTANFGFKLGPGQTSTSQSNSACVMSNATDKPFLTSKLTVIEMENNSITDSEAHRRNLRRLNESVLRWIEQHIQSDPHCILSPIFEDYNKYIEQLERKFGGLEASSSSSGSSSAESDIQHSEANGTAQTSGTDRLPIASVSASSSVSRNSTEDIAAPGFFTKPTSNPPTSLEEVTTLETSTSRSTFAPLSAFASSTPSSASGAGLFPTGGLSSAPASNLGAATDTGGFGGFFSKPTGFQFGNSLLNPAGQTQQESAAGTQPASEEDEKYEPPKKKKVPTATLR